MLELIEQRASRAGVPVDSRIERGRSHRHALATLLEHERYDTLVVPARTSTSDGFEPADVAWLLENAPGEVLVLRTGEARQGATPVSRGHLTARRSAARLAGWFFSANSGFSDADW